MLPGSASERQGILRSGARMFAAQSTAQVPKFEITLRAVWYILSYERRAGGE